MRVIKRNLKSSRLPSPGSIRLRIEHPDDLYHLYQLIDEGDRATSLTERREEEKGDRIRADRAEKRKMVLTLEVVKAEFAPFTDRLRVLGTIEEGPQDHGQHHAFNLTVGDDITIRKERWRGAHMDRIKQAAKPQPQAIIIAVDSDSGVVAQMTSYGVKELASAQAQGAGKYAAAKGARGKQPKGKSGASGRDEVYIELVEAAAQAIVTGTPTVIIGPGFFKEQVAALARERFPETFASVRVENASCAGMSGVHEALRAGTLTSAAGEARLQTELSAMEELLKEIGRLKGLAAYGHREVKEAIAAGAAERLLVTDEHARTERGRRMLEAAYRAHVESLTISTHHDGGQTLDKFGGAAVMLRYRADQP